MNRKTLYSMWIMVFVWAIFPAFANAQSRHHHSRNAVQQRLSDSLQEVRQQRLDSLKAVRTKVIDSLKEIRQARIDSIKRIQQHRTDSLNAVKAYRESKQYKDSLAQIQQHRKDSLLAIRQHMLDSTKQARQRYTDSVVASRKHILDSIKLARQHFKDSLTAYFDSVHLARTKILAKMKAEREHRKDSLLAIQTYRKSAAYKDSLAAIQKHRKDSLIAIRKHYTDSIRAVQKAYTDSLIAARKVYNDSLKASLDSIKLARQHTLDSLHQAMKVRSDSLASVKAKRDAEREKLEKERTKKKALALEIKFKQKEENYSNKSMLKKKWSLIRKIAQNTFTRYNYYYNAKLKMQEADKNMLLANQDDYDSLLQLFPFDPNRDSARLLSDMDTIIKRASLGIQIHDPRSKWQDDLYLLVGQAYYYKADYENAGAAFKQIIITDEKQRKDKEKKKNKKRASEKNKPQTFSVPRKKGIAGLLEHVPAKNEAMLWLSRTFAQNGQSGQAQTLLDLLRNDANFPKNLNGELALEQAFVNLKNNDDKDAVHALSVVAKDKDMEKWQRQRAGYIAAQIYDHNKKTDSANHYFQEVLALHPPIQMDFYARKSIALNTLQASGKEQQTVKMLEDLAQDGKYKPFYDQIYYGIALAELKSGDAEKAMQDFRTSLSFGKNNPKQMGLTYTQIGDANYKKRAYLTAKRDYDSAVVLLNKFQSLPEYQRALLRGSSLAQIAGPASTVERLDSLLQLASLTEKAQREIIRKHIRQLEKAKQDSLFLAQNGVHSAASSGNLFNSPVASSWYFSNPSTVTSGKSAFKQKWGDRPLEDNWWLSGNNFSGGNSQNASTQTAQNSGLSGIPDEDELYKAIPHTPAELKAVKDTLQEALFLLGKGYYTYLEDFPNSTHTFDTLDKKFPSNPHQDEVLYIRYLMALRTGNHDQSAHYLNLLAENFPNSQWTKLLQSATEKEQQIKKDTVNNPASLPIDIYYGETYDMLMKKQYALVLKRVKDYPEKYPAPGNYVYKFRILEAVAYAGSGEEHKADSILTAFLKQSPDKALTDWASDLLKYLHRNDHPTNNASAGGLSNSGQQQVAFTYNPAEPYLIIIAAPADDRIFALKSSLRDFNLMQNGSGNIGIFMTTLNPQDNLIICQTFKNLAEATAYMNNIKKSKNLFSDYPNKEYHLLLISQSNYTKMLNQRSLKDYLGFYQKHFH